MAKIHGVRGAAGWCALAALLYLLAHALLELFVSFLMGLRVPGASLAQPVGFSPAAVSALQLLVGAMAIAVPLLFLLAMTRLRPRDLRLLLPSQWAPGFCLLLFLGLANLANLFSGLLGLLLGAPRTGTTLPAGGAVLAVDFLLLCVLPAIGEELLFRGALQGLLRPAGSAAAILGPALLFALLHLDLAQGVTAFVCAVFLGWLAERSGSILPGMLLHFVNNCLAFLTLYLQQYAPQHLALAVELGVLLGCPLAGGIVLWRALRQGFRFDAGLRPGPAASTVFASPAYSATAAGLLVYTLWLQWGGLP